MEIIVIFIHCIYVYQPRAYLYNVHHQPDLQRCDVPHFTMCRWSIQVEPTFIKHCALQILNFFISLLCGLSSYLISWFLWVAVWLSYVLNTSLSLNCALSLKIDYWYSSVIVDSIVQAFSFVFFSYPGSKYHHASAAWPYFLLRKILWWLLWVQVSIW